MKELDLYTKKLLNEKTDGIEISCRPVESIRDKIDYTNVFIKGFNKKRYKFLVYYMNCLDSHYTMYLITLGEKIIGCFALRAKGKKTFYLYDFTILPEYRGQGYSRQALRMIYTLSLMFGKKRLSLYLRKNNSVAFNLYVSEGFEKYKKQK